VSMTFILAVAFVIAVAAVAIIVEMHGEYSVL